MRSQAISAFLYIIPDIDAKSYRNIAKEEARSLATPFAPKHRPTHNAL
jgi:hypothetical protein